MKRESKSWLRRFPNKYHWLEALLGHWITVLLTKLLPCYQNLVPTLKSGFGSSVASCIPLFFTASAICLMSSSFRKKGPGFSLSFHFPATRIHLETSSWWLRFCYLLSKRLLKCQMPTWYSCIIYIWLTYGTCCQSALVWFWHIGHAQ